MTLPAPRVVAVFTAALWTNQSRLRVWAKQVEADLVLLTDNVTDANAVLARQLRCSLVATAIVRAGGVERSGESMVETRGRRDWVMVSLASEIVVFVSADDAVWWEHFARGSGLSITIFVE